jgi:hypothetical protein
MDLQTGEMLEAVLVYGGGLDAESLMPAREMERNRGWSWCLALEKDQRK